jgi:cytochrome c oxidase subunit 4
MERIITVGLDGSAEIGECHDDSAHPGTALYIGVAVVLAVVTAVEVGLYYTSLTGLRLVSLLAGLAAVKFGMVAAYFMHLKFDGRLLRRLFGTGIVLAGGVYTIALLTMDVLVG